MPSQTAHRAALPDLRLSERFGIVVSSWYYRRCSSIIPFFTVALHEPVRFSNACNLRRSRYAAQLHVGDRPVSKGATETIRRSMALESRPLLDARLRIFDGVGDRASIVISRVSYTPKAILLVRDPFRGKMRFRSRPFERRQL